MSNQNKQQGPLPWILPLRRFRGPERELKERVARVLDVIPSRLYLTLGEFRALEWTQDEATLEKVLDVIREDKASGKLDRYRDLLDVNRPYEERHLLMLYDFLMDAYHRVERTKT